MRGKRQKRKLICNFNFDCAEFGVENFIYATILFRLCPSCFSNKQTKTVHTLQCTLYTVHYVQHRPELSTLETSQGGGHMGELRMWLFSRLCWMYWGCTHHILNWYLSWSQEWGCCSHHLQSQMAFQRWTGCGHSYCSCTWGSLSWWVLQVWFLNPLPVFLDLTW